MRTFELVLWAVVVLAVYLPVVLSIRLKRGRIAGALMVVLVLQVVFEGVRWQMWPMYLAALGLTVGDLLWEERRVRGWPRLRRASLGVLGVGLVAVLPMALPVPVFPRPSGPYAVGTMTVVVVDSEREEIYGAVPEEEPEAGEDAEEEVALPPREFVVQVWYPAFDDPDVVPDLWNPDWDVVGPAMASRLGVPGFVLSHLGDLRGTSKPGLEILSGRLPVVLYSHGWTGFRTIALNQVESLASHGYIVIAPDHAYGAIASRFPDGEVVMLDENALPDPEGVDPGDYDEAASELIETFTDDLIAIVDQLEAEEEGAFALLAGHFDLEHLGAFGHSAGGGAVVRFCIEDDRCDAVLGEDAWVEPIPDRIVADELSQPSLFLRSEEWVDTTNDRRLRGLAERSESGSYWVSIDGADHNDFVMTPLLSPIAGRLGWKGSIAADRMVPIIDEYLVAFFDRNVFEFGGAILDELPPPEVDVEYLP